MSVRLESLTACFQGLLPAQLFTCAADGTPNAAYLSHVEYVDPRHVALSYQFFNKSKRNIAENPRALVLLLDPDTGQGYQLRLRYVRSETAGALFERMAWRIEAIASYCGLKGVFKLLASDVYEVLSVELAPEERGIGCEEKRREGRIEPDPVFTLVALQDMTERVNGADSLEALVDSILSGLEDAFGFRQSMILVPGEEPGVLVTIATRGYAEGGAGAEVRIGEGIAGVVAEARQPIRISGLLRGMLYALAMHRDALAASPPRCRIPVPGQLGPQSQLGVPLLVRGELVGVLVAESDAPYRFHEQDRASVELLGSYLAIAIQNMQLHERAADAGNEPLPPEPSARADEALVPLPVGAADSGTGPSPSSGPMAAHASRSHAATPSAATSAPREVVYYQGDETILVDDEYLIRSLPARILWRLLQAHRATGRTEFTNRELRLDKSLQLPELKDNLETRLLLLRRRLEQKCPEIRLTPVSRGRFALELACELKLETRP